MQKWEAAELECVTGCGEVPEFESGTSPDDSVCELRSGEGVNHVEDVAARRIEGDVGRDEVVDREGVARGRDAARAAGGDLHVGGG